MAGPLTELLKGKSAKIDPCLWTRRQSESVLALKRAITQYPVLRQFDQTKPIYVVTDASDYAIGGCLFQYHGEPPAPCAVQYISRQMIPAERNYDVREKECLAIKYTLAQLRHYLLASRFTVKCLSDHRSLQYLKKGKEIGGRIARWALALGEFDYEIEYIKGADNQLADLLSRLVAAEASDANQELGHDDMAKPKAQCMSLMSLDIASSVARYHQTNRREGTEPHEEESHRDLFEPSH